MERERLILCTSFLKELKYCNLGTGWRTFFIAQEEQSMYEKLGALGMLDVYMT